MGDRRRKKKQAPAQEGGLPTRAQPEQPRLLQLQRDAGNRAVSDLVSSLSGVPKPQLIRTPVGVTATVYFARNSALLDIANFQAIEQLAEELRYLYEPVVKVDGHASGEGKEAQNQSLSERRRTTVIALLTGRLKTPPAVKGEAFGETQPAVAEEAGEAAALEQQRAQNRRVEITIVYDPRTVAAPEKPKIDLGLGRTRFDPPPTNPFDFKPPPPVKRPKSSIGGEFDKKFNEVVDDALDGLGIKKGWMRSLLKKGARAAIDKGTETLLDEAMDEAGLKGETREAFKKSIEAGLKFEF